MAGAVGEQAIAPPVRIGQADARLELAIEGRWWIVGVAAMLAVDAVDRRSAVPLQPEERADAIHGFQDSESPAGKTAELTRLE